MRKIYFFIILFILGLVLLPYQSGALTISPAKIILSADPGETITTVMVVRNDLERTLIFYPAFEAYTTRGGEEPVFFETNRGLPTWIETNPLSVTLGEKETASVEVIIKVPEDAEPGSHFAAIFWSAAPPTKGTETGVGIVTRVGALVLLDVSGEVVNSAEIVGFKTPQKFFTHLPVSFIYDLKNEGTVYVMPDGKIIIKNIFGGTSGVLNINPSQAHVMPGTTRTIYAQNWEPEGGMPKIEGEGIFQDFQRELKGFALGYYRANLTIEYGKDEIKTTQANCGFWVVPWRILILTILVLSLLILGIIKGIQKYNQWVINKVEERIRRGKR